MIRKAHSIILAVALLSALFMGCATKDIYLTNYSTVQEGVTTKRDVLGMFGKPKFILPNRDGSEKWSYDVDASSDFVDKHHTFNFHFDKNGVIIDKSTFLSKWP